VTDYQTPYETKDFTGALFRNDKKETDSHPDYRGSATINGVEYWVSSWVNTSAKGQKYMSLKYSPKEEVHEKGMAQAKAAATDQREAITGQAAAPQDTFDDDVPF
jgi:uncharacterized protein (DUF736 family)